MTRTLPFEAVISDMDGVLTRTAKLHERAWKRMFDAFLSAYPGQRPFSSADYRAHVDGKPRYQGVADLLASRKIDLPRGEPSDSPDVESMCGLGNRKNGFFLELLGQGSVEVFEDSVHALERWRRGALKLAAVSASKNCRHVLKAARLDHYFDVIVDGARASELHLPGKAQIMLQAAHDLNVRPADAVILEDATAGIRAGRRDNFGLVVGVARVGNDNDLHDAGANLVVRNVSRVRFMRRIPHVLDRLDELSAWRAGRPLAVFLDYDGTLSPIVSNPRDAWLSDEMRLAVKTLVDRWPVAIISGRDRDDVQARVAIDGLFYAGNHGFDIAGRGHSRIVPEAAEALGELDLAARELTQHLGRLAGVLIERKRYSVAVHYRQVDSEGAVPQVARAVDIIRQKTGLRLRTGKKVFELEPAVDWDKGRALRWLVDVLRSEHVAESFLLYIGDDETDEDAFFALGGLGAGIRVGGSVTTSLADYHVADTQEVSRVLRLLTASA